MNSQATRIECTAGQVSSELIRYGVLPQERVTVVIFQESELIPGRRETRARIIAAGLTDADIDCLIEDARRDVDEEMSSKAAISP